MPTTRRTTTATVSQTSASSSTTRPAGDDEIEPVLLGEEFLDTTGFVFDHRVRDRTELGGDASALATPIARIG